MELDGLGFCSCYSRHDSGALCGPSTSCLPQCHEAGTIALAVGGTRKLNCVCRLPLVGKGIHALFWPKKVAYETSVFQKCTRDFLDLPIHLKG